MAVSQHRVLKTALPGPQSQQLHARRLAAVSAGVGSTLPVYVAEAGGGIVVDVDGNQLIDFGSGIAVVSVGNAAPRVVDAVSAQVRDFTHTCFMITPYEEYVAVAEALNERTPGSFAKRSALFNSGAEAVENAIKIARSATGRSAVVAFDHAYHGRTNLTTAKSMPYKHRFGPFAGEVYRVPMAYPYRWPTGPDACAEEAFAEFTSLVHTQVGEDDTAAVIIEPIQGEGGFIVPPPGFLAQVAAWCREHGIVFIADEIQTGFCRTGDWFACEHEQAAVTGRAELMDAVHPGGLGGTYGGNPVTCAAALAAIETMAVEDLCGAARQIEAVMLPRLTALADKFSAVGDVRGRGAMLALELVEPGTHEPAPGLAAAVSAACHQQGLITLTAGTYGNVLRFLPPLVIGTDLLTEGLDILEGSFAALC